MPDAIAIRNTIFNTSSAANFFLKLNHDESKLTSIKWVRNKHLILQSNIFLCCPLALLTSKNNRQHQHTDQLSLWDDLRHTKQLSLWISQGQAKFKKNKETIIVSHVGNASKIWTEELLTTPESHFTVRKTQSERHWVWGEVLTPRVSRPWKQSNKMYVLWSFPARRLHQLQPPREAAGGQHQGLCFCHNVLMLAVFYTSLDNSTAPQLSALQDIRLRLSIPSFQASLHLSAQATPQNPPCTPLPCGSSAGLFLACWMQSASKAGVREGKSRRRLLSTANFPGLTLW